MKSFILSEEMEKEVEKVISAGKEKYAIISHIILESDFDASIYFEDDFENCIEN